MSTTSLDSHLSFRLAVHTNQQTRHPMWLMIKTPRERPPKESVPYNHIHFIHSKTGALQHELSALGHTRRIGRVAKYRQPWTGNLDTCPNKPESLFSNVRHSVERGLQRGSEANKLPHHKQCNKFWFMGIPTLRTQAPAPEFVAAVVEPAPPPCAPPPRTLPVAAWQGPCPHPHLPAREHKNDLN